MLKLVFIYLFIYCLLFFQQASIPQLTRQIPTITFYIKTSAKLPYYKKAVEIHNTWGKHLNIYYLTDSNETIIGSKKSTTYVQGTELQHYYKQKNRTTQKKGFMAQRLKTRAVFKRRISTDWICYFDDDMVVNFERITQELKDKNGIIGDVSVIRGYVNYTMGGWCMDRKNAERVQSMFKKHTDKQLGWQGVDDTSFCILLRKKLNIIVQNSPKWMSEYSKIIGMDKKITLREDGYDSAQCEKNETIIEKTIEHLSVYWKKGPRITGKHCKK